MAELAEGARLLSECGVKSLTEGSNPSLSAIFITVAKTHSLISDSPAIPPSQRRILALPL